MSFRLAARVAALFDGAVDAVHFAEHQLHDADIAVQSMPHLKILSDDRLKARAEESQRRFRELIAPIKGATFTGDEAMTRDEPSTSVVSPTWSSSAGRAPMTRISHPKRSRLRSTTVPGRW